MTNPKISDEAREAAEVLRTYLSIRGLKDGEIERAFQRIIDQTLERAAKDRGEPVAPDMKAIIGMAIAHISAMQNQCRQYLEPAGYTSYDRKRIAFESEHESQSRMFISDMIYLLDGPEQRAMQAGLESALQSLTADGELA